MTKSATTQPKREVRQAVLADGTYDAIKAMILDHTIAPGARLGIDQLSRKLSVSPTPVREALARLESDALVTKIPLRGYTTTNLLSVSEFEALFQFRLLVEPWLAAQAASRATRREIDAMKAELARANAIPHGDAPTNVENSFEHDVRIHTMIAHAAGSSFVERAYLQTHAHMHLFRVYRAMVRVEEAREGTPGDEKYVPNIVEGPIGLTGRSALGEHTEIVDAIADRDGAQAQKFMTQHIESSHQSFSRALEALNPTVTPGTSPIVFFPSLSQPDGD